MSKAHRPQITIAQETVDHLEALVEGASARMPALADRLLEELSRARILPAARIPADVVGIGSRITWRDETTGHEQTATLVWPEQADIDAGRASVLTPIGVALLGLKAGARFQWETRGGECRDLTVLAVGPGDRPA
ncbi:nucleoside diphosphate kinase regulator [Tabrizicola sp.]|jgi:regulator of nucleoside diphosphate kinase|uniref:nucleoside diphosphate kinase regulator n=1 Tax=Tabrizicola sp. TaxID=2005166 RepID=UPI001A5AA4EC|nr:nucleoside diphosphate kinase regulator [Tabrizicola sp.]MBL9062052.1 nucleoside diphosphate kinase regulator [Tabrizicola sp.]